MLNLLRGKKPVQNPFELQLTNRCRGTTYQCSFCLLHFPPHKFLYHFGTHFNQRDRHSKPHYAMPYWKGIANNRKQ